jgi:sporulation protein YlmC with PRC-barrel domain
VGVTRWGYPYPADPVYPGYPGYPERPYVAETEQNIPEDTVALAEGAKVYGSDGEHVGDVEQVFMDAQTDQATHLVISRGLLLKERKLVPTTWATTVGEDEVYLSVDSSFMDRLPDYKESS